MVLDGRNKYTLLKEASQVLDRYEMKFTFNEEGVSDPNGNCVVPKISAKFLKAACTKGGVQVLLIRTRSVSARQRDGTPNSPIPSCQMVDRQKAWWSLRRIQSGLSGPNSQVTVPDPCHVC